MGKRFLITEDDREHILSLYAKKGIIIEQIETINSGNVTNDWQVGENLEKDINKIIQDAQNKIFKQITLQFVSGPKNEKTDPFVFSVLKNGKDTGQKMTLNYEYIEDRANFQAYSIYRSLYKSISFGKTSIVEYLRPIFKNRDYITLFEKYPSVEKYVKNLTVDFGIEPYESGDIAIGGMVRKGDGEYKLRRPLPFGDKITSMGSGVTIFKLKLNKKLYFSLELANAKMRLAEIKIPNPGVKPVEPTPPTPPIVVSIEIKLDLTDPFKFDKTELTDIGKSKFEDFILKIKQVKNKYGEKIYEEYINFLKNNKIKVTTSSSIDQDPNGKTADSNNSNSTTLESCRVPGGRLRKEYNKCLSEKRASVIIEKITEEIPDLNGAFIPNAIGETDQFDPGKKWPNYKPNETVQNRRLDIDVPVFGKTEVLKPTN